MINYYNTFVNATWLTRELRFIKCKKHLKIIYHAIYLHFTTKQNR